MVYSGYELIWLFFVYSFLGWIWETLAAAFQKKKFVNRGLVNLPFCILYGIAAVFITVFCRELRGFWLYLGSFILVTVFKWCAGHLIERMYHERWWDYSHRRWNVEGYISLVDSALRGALAMVMMKWGNALVVQLFRMIPGLCRGILIWLLVIFLFVDIMVTLLALRGKREKMKQLAKVEGWFDGFTTSLSQKIFECVEKRISNAYSVAKKAGEEEKSAAVFAYGCSFYKMVWLFLIASFLGDIIETIFCRITMGRWMSRSSVVWGPFSIVWGLAFVFATILLHKYRNKPDRTIFLVGTFLGGAYEYICSMFTELVFGKVFWDYSEVRFNLGGRINLLFCFFWGIAAVVWIKWIYPVISGWIEKIPLRIGKIVSWFLVVFMCCNMVVSSLALVRSTQRKDGVQAEYGWQKIMDEKYDDEKLESIYPNAINTE